MSTNPNMPFNQAIRNAGNRSRVLQPMPIPNIGQDTQMPAPQAPPPVAPGSMGMAAPRVQPSTFTMHPPGTPADTHQYNYEPQADGSWRVYPPGVDAPGHTFQASLPRAASTGDYMRMSNAFRSMQQQPPAPVQPQQAPPVQVQPQQSVQPPAPFPPMP